MPRQRVIEGRMYKLRILTVFLIVFSLGWLLNSLITNFVVYDAEKPLPLSILPFSKSPEIASPGDHIKESQIHVYNDKVVVDVKGANWASFTNTNSMDPYLDAEANSIEIAPKSPKDINPGDIISYYSGITGDLIVHRVTEKGVDERGTFFLVKGDNNSQRDPEKIRFSQIHGLLIGIIY